jgi:hydroxyacylglutathione hydrolase
MLQVTPVPAFRDNYIWMLHDDRNAVAVDPGDAAPVEAFLKRTGLRLVNILVTHHHPDHVGGVSALVDAHGSPVFGPAREGVPRVTHRLGDGDAIELPELGLRYEVMDISGHTAGHIAYFGHGMVFCGDTLFACGCGRLFEGTPEQMTRSLSRLAALPGGTEIYCGHEYTLANIRFARAVEPGSSALAGREARESAKRERDEPTLPSTIAEELATNPFLRTQVPEVAAAAARHAGRTLREPVEIFATLREWKNNF